MRSDKKKLLIIIISICFLTFVFFSISLRTPTRISLESKFGTFCLECKTFETGSGISIYGFGIAYCNDKIRQMSKKVNYYEIEKYKIFLNSNGFNNLSNKVSDISNYIKINNTEKYITTVIDYNEEIEHLNSSDKEIILSYF